MKNDFKNKKVLLIGLGILGGGVTTANWLLKQGAKLTIFDSKTKEFLKNSIKQIKGKAVFVFENCDDKIVEDTDIVVINQAVPMTNPQVILAEKLGKPIYNEARIFYENCTKPIIAITGTRGKTTTTNWTVHLLGKKAMIAGNSITQQPLKMLP
jgi:UDP-N-acetylmuramoylalanine--D-glutamate ligase